jgi:hypothetical protein
VRKFHFPISLKKATPPLFYFYFFNSASDKILRLTFQKYISRPKQINTGEFCRTVSNQWFCKLQGHSKSIFLLEGNILDFGSYHNVTTLHCNLFIFMF